MKLIHNDKKTVKFETDGDWTLKVGDIDILKNLKLLKVYDDAFVWQSLTPMHDGWLRLRARWVPGATTVNFWAWWVAGDTGIEAPRIAQPAITIIATAEPLVDLRICPRSPLHSDPMLEGFTSGGLLHGQGTVMHHFVVDFEENEWDHGDSVQEPNRYMPASPNQTGGNWDYMGQTFPVEVIPNRLIYAAGCYGGFFQHGDSGQFVTEADFPELQADSHIHAGSKDRGWIKYTAPSTPWRDRMKVMYSNPDGAHACQISVLAQVAQFRPEDEGLKMLLEAWSNVYLRSFPAQPRGTSHANPGSERSQGRVVKSGVDAFLACHSFGSKEDEHIGLRFGTRVLQRWGNQRDLFLANFKKRGFGFSQYRDTGMYAANEIGIHFWGIYRLHLAFDQLGAEHNPELHYWMETAAKWLFDSFRYYGELAGDRRWGHPYYENADHTTPLASPTSSSHFAWFGAMQHEPVNSTEWVKRGHIMALGEGMPARFKS